MPYVTKEERIVPKGRPTEGQLNYFITQWILWYLGKDPHYADFNAAVGVLECAKMELYRRMVVPYEDQKIKSNGDVYPCKN